MENKKNLWLAFSRMSHPNFASTERTFVKGEGAHLFDKEGRKYFDAFSTLWTNLIGHGRQEVIEAMTEQMRNLSFMHLFSGTQHEPALKLSDRLIEDSPFSHAHCFFGLSGSDATDTAMKLARHYWFSKGRATKNILVARKNTYHGTTFGALSLMGHDDYQVPYQPLVGRTHRVSPTDFVELEKYFQQVNAKENVAALLFEPVITSDGLILPPDGYWKQTQELCRKHEVLLICDEVSTGMGRTGEFYAASLYGLKPDITYLAKSITSGYAPLSVVLTSEEIFKTINDANKYFMHGSTFAGYPAACVAALKVLEIIKREDLLTRAKKLSLCLKQSLESELLPLENIGSINGMGTLFEVTLAKGRDLNRPLKNEVELGMAIYAELLSRGQYVRALGRFLCIAPPLVATDSEIATLARDIKDVVLKVSANKELWN